MARKKKTRASKKRATSLTPNRIATSKGLTKEHDAAIKLVAKAVVAADSANAKVAAAKSKVDAAKAKVAVAAKKASGPRATAAAKRAAATARAAAKKVSDAMQVVKAKARELNVQLKDSVKAAEMERKKEEAKQKAVNAFAAKWQAAYDKKAAKKKKKRRKKRRAKVAI